MFGTQSHSRAQPSQIATVFSCWFSFTTSKTCFSSKRTFTFTTTKRHGAPPRRTRRPVFPRGETHPPFQVAPRSGIFPAGRRPGWRSLSSTWGSPAAARRSSRPNSRRPFEPEPSKGGRSRGCSETQRRGFCLTVLGKDAILEFCWLRCWFCWFLGLGVYASPLWVMSCRLRMLLSVGGRKRAQEKQTHER